MTLGVVTLEEAEFVHHVLSGDCIFYTVFSPVILVFMFS